MNSESSQRHGGLRYQCPFRINRARPPPPRISSRNRQVARRLKTCDVYRNVLGPTTDESILAGLQTVMDLCLSRSPYHSEYSETDSSEETVSGGSSLKYKKSTGCMTKRKCHVQCLSVKSFIFTVCSINRFFN